MTDSKNAAEVVQDNEIRRKGAQRGRNLSAAEFEELAPLLAHLDSTRVEAARLYMVEKLTMAEVVHWIRNKYGISQTRQAVNGSCSKVWEVYERLQSGKAAAAKQVGKGVEIPAGWVQVTVWAPPRLVPEIHAMLAEAQRSELRIMTEQAKAELEHLEAVAAQAGCEAVKQA